jgi:hypothetical protein
MPIARKFDVESLAKVADPDAVVNELAQVLTARLRAAEDPEREARAIEGELRALGHAPYAEARVRPVQRCLDVELVLVSGEPEEEDGRPYALAHYRWPSTCPDCGAGLAEASPLRIQVPSDGSVGALSVEVVVELPGRPRIQQRLGGPRSVPLLLRALVCPQCHGAFIPGAAAPRLSRD